MAGTGSLCRCICGSRKDDTFDSSKVFRDDALAEYEDASASPRSHVVGVLSYDATVNQPLRGVPIREESLHLLSSEDEVVETTVSLYVNGFEFRHRGVEHSFSFPPFVMVRNCKFQAVTQKGIDLANYRCFKVSMFTHGVCLYFGVPAAEDESAAEEKRSNWVMDISRAVRLVTQSLFPVFHISVKPLPDVPTTNRRIMAGYLAHHDDSATTSVLYCELHPQLGEKARLALYENESCQVCLSEISVTARTSCTEKVGISCTCFTIEQHLFSSRSIAERKLWLRAISNIKVKLQNAAPDANHEDLYQYRVAILEHAKQTGCNDSQAMMDALLMRHAKKSDFPAMPFGYNEDGFFVEPAPPDVEGGWQQPGSLGLPAAMSPAKQPDMAGAGDYPVEGEIETPQSSRSPHSAPRVVAGLQLEGKMGL